MQGTHSSEDQPTGRARCRCDIPPSLESLANGLRYWRWGGRGLCLGAEKNSKQEKCSKMRRNPQRPVHAVLGRFCKILLILFFYLVFQMAIPNVANKGSCSGASEPVSNRIRTSRFRCATSGRQARDPGFRSEVVHVAIDIPSDLPRHAHIHRPLRVRPGLRRQLHPTHALPHVPLPQLVRLHKPLPSPLRSSLWLPPWRDRRPFELASL